MSLIDYVSYTCIHIFGIVFFCATRYVLHTSIGLITHQMDALLIRLIVWGWGGGGVGGLGGGMLWYLGCGIWGVQNYRSFHSWEDACDRAV